MYAREGRHAVVWRHGAAQRLVVLLPVVRHNIPRHRGDVLLDSLADLAALGCAGRDLMIRCAHPIGRAPCALGVLTGRATPSLLLRLSAAYERARQAAGYEGAHALLRDDLS